MEKTEEINTKTQKSADQEEQKEEVAENGPQELERPLMAEGQPKRSFQELKDELLSKVPAGETVTELPAPRFLDSKDEHELIVLCHAFRSGALLARGYIEKVMGLPTGSDRNMELPLNKQLVALGNQGEGLTDQSVWVADSAFPDRIGMPFKGDRGVLMLRNPLDQFVSLFHVLVSGQLDLSVDEGDFNKFSRHWDELIKQEVSVWKEYYEYWLQKASTFPLHIMSYEGLMKDPAEALTGFFKFALRVESLTGTRVEQYIRLACAQDRPQTYPPRAANVGTGIKNYSKAQLELLFEYSKDVLAKLGQTEFYGKDIIKNEKSDFEFIPQHNYATLQMVISSQNSGSQMEFNDNESNLRQRSVAYPEGRFNMKTTVMCKHRATILGESVFNFRVTSAMMRRHKELWLKKQEEKKERKAKRKQERKEQGKDEDEGTSDESEDEKENQYNRITKMRQQEKKDFAIIRTEDEMPQELKKKPIDFVLESQGKGGASFKGDAMIKSIQAALKVFSKGQQENQMSKRDQIDFIGDLPRPLFEKRKAENKIWEFAKLKKWYLERGSEIDKLTELPELTFLDGKETLMDKSKGQRTEQETVIMASYPRCGNTMLRSLMEKIMGVCTGSDNDITLGLVGALMDAGFDGEGLTDKRVWVVKTHFPANNGFKPYEADRIILLIRSPLDSLVSYFNLEGAKSHSKSLDKDDYVNFDETWSAWIKQELSVWRDFTDYYLNCPVPLHVVRYEDIIERQEETLVELFQFMMRTDHLEGTRIRKYIELACSENMPQRYKPRKGKVNANLDYYKKAQLNFLYFSNKRMMDRLGYAPLFKNMAVDPFPEYLKQVNDKNLHVSRHLDEIPQEQIFNILCNNDYNNLRAPEEMYQNGRNEVRVDQMLKPTPVGNIRLTIARIQYAQTEAPLSSGLTKLSDADYKQIMERLEKRLAYAEKETEKVRVANVALDAKEREFIKSMGIDPDIRTEFNDLGIQGLETL